MRYRIISDQADRTARWLAVALAFTIPISTALDGVLLALIPVLWLAGAGYREKLRSIRHNPVALAALVLLAMVAIGTFYGSGSLSDTLNYGGKYAGLLYLVLLIPLFRDPWTRRYGMAAFIAAMLLTLALSYLLALRLLPAGNWIWGGPTDAAIFKDHITQNILMAYLAFVCAMKASTAPTLRTRVIWWTLVALAIFDVLFLVQGRSGYLVLALLIPYFLYEWRRWQGLAIAAVVTVLLGGVGYLASTTMHVRVNEAVNEYIGWRHGHDKGTPIGLRMGFYQNSLAIIREHPAFGVGTGGFVHAYAKQVKGTSWPMTTNPHNQYLLTTVELGVTGLALLLYLFYTQWRTARMLTSRDRVLARALILTIASGSLVNSLLIDQTERLFFELLSALLYGGLVSAATSLPHRTEDGSQLEKRNLRW